MSDSVLSDSLAALSRFFVGDSTVAQTLLRVAELTVAAVPPADLVGLTLAVEGRQRTAVFTDDAAPRSIRPSTTPGRVPVWPPWRSVRCSLSPPLPRRGGGRRFGRRPPPMGSAAPCPCPWWWTSRGR